MNTCPNCGMVKGMHASILPGCKCPWTPQETDCYGDGNVYRGVRSKDSFNPDWNTEAVLVEEMQRMAKRIEDLETEQDCVGWFGYDTGLRLWFETNKGDDDAIPLYKARSKT